MRYGSPVVEVVLLSAAGGRLRYRVRRHPLDAAAHACRHLALLVRTDEAVALAARELPDLWELIGKLPSGCAGGLAPVGLARV